MQNADFNLGMEFYNNFDEIPKYRVSNYGRIRRQNGSKVCQYMDQKTGKNYVIRDGKFMRHYVDDLVEYCFPNLEFPHQ